MPRLFSLCNDYLVTIFIIHDDLWQYPVFPKVIPSQKYAANKGPILKSQGDAVVYQREFSTGNVDWSAEMEKLTDREVLSVFEQTRI
jgi:hypothetical protein